VIQATLIDSIRKSPTTDYSHGDLSVAELDRKINEQRDAVGVKIRAWLTQDQAAVWENALEVCRRMTGEDLDVGR